MAQPPPNPSGDPPGDPEPPREPQTRPDSPQNRRRGRPPARTRLRNRRYAALRELLRGSDYFSEERMRLRAPALFHHYIGRFQDPKNPQIPQNHPKILPGDPKILPGDPKIPRNDPKILPGEPPDPPGPPRSLRELLLHALDQGPAEDDDEEEEEEEEEEDDDDEDEGRVPEAAERELLRREFTTRMYQSFLEGQDGDFDYSQVDENPELDNLDIVSRDLEDRYFDEEEPSLAPSLE